MNNVGGISTTQAMQGIDLGPTNSLQFQFAKLQLALAEQAKNGAMGHMNDIQESQAKQKEVAEFIAKARALREEAKNDNARNMPSDMVKYMKENNIPYDTYGNDNLHNKDEWDYNIKSMQNYQEQLGTNTQQKMVFVQDFMGQYNSYLQGANTQINQSNQILASLARGQ